MVRPAVFFVFMCGALSGYLAQQDWQPLFDATTPQAAAVSLSSSSTTPAGPLTITQQLDTLTLEQKVGQLLMVGHWKQDYYQHTLNMIKVHELGGVIIMQVDDQHIADVQNWTTAWQDASTIPLLISIDQEGGVVSRLKTDEFSQTSQRELTSTAAAYELGTTRGDELSTLGINTNLAPVIDYASDPDSFLYSRSFATSSDISELADGLITGHAASDVLAIPKHYPGHADTQDDSHVTLPVVDITAAQFPEHVAQFRDLLETTKVDALMTAHVQFPKLDDEYPVTLSYEILSRQLRRDLGFEGVIITDDMTMGAITNQWTSSEAAVQAIKAGADMILFAAEPNAAMQAKRYILNALESGELSEEQVDAAVTRILELKQKQGLLE